MRNGCWRRQTIHLLKPLTGKQTARGPTVKTLEINVGGDMGSRLSFNLDFDPLGSTEPNELVSY